MPSFGAASFWMNDSRPVEPLRRRGMPLLLAALALATGIAAARQWHGPAMLATATGLLLVLSWVSLRWAPGAGWVAVLGFWMAVGCWCATLQPPAPRSRAAMKYADGLSRTVQGHVLSMRTLPPTLHVRGSPGLGLQSWQLEPGGWEPEAEADKVTSLDLQLTAVEEVNPDVSTLVPLAGGLRVTLAGPLASLRCGDLVEVPVRLRIPETYRDPGAFSYASWLAEQDISALANGKAARLRVVGAGRPDLRCELHAAQRWAANRLEALPVSAGLRHLPAAVRLSGADAGMLAAMLFGDRSALGKEQRAGFERTGTFHLFVVSGLHVALLTGGLFWVLRKLRVPESVAVGITVALAAVYAALTGFGVPAQRALVMASLVLVARALDRSGHGLNGLGLASVLILVADPRALFTASFQMTALVIFAAAGIAQPLSQRWLGAWRSVVYQLTVVELDARLHPQIAARRVGLRFWGSLLGEAVAPWMRRGPEMAVRGALLGAEFLLFSASVELCMAVPMAVYFHRMVPMALLGNLLVAPVAMVLVVLATVTALACFCSGWLAVMPAVLTAGLLHGVMWGVGALGQLRGSDLRVPGPPPTLLVVCCGLGVAALALLRLRRPWLAGLGFGAVAMLPVLVAWPVRPLLRPAQLEVTAIDVGQGDSLLVVSPEGKTLLVDAGGPVGRVASKWDVGEEVVAPYLWSRRLRRLDAVLITHGHSDHIGGMPAVLRDLRPRELWLSLAPGQSAAMRELLAQAATQGIAVHWLAAGDHFAWGGTEATVLAPERNYANYGEARNDDSLVMRLDWQRASVLLEGDAETPSEEAMVSHGRLRPVSLLKVGHHGSRTSSTEAFLQAVAPRYAVISVGKGNTFGHPRWEVLDRLQTAGVKTFRTDLDGAETMLLTADGRVTAQSAAEEGEAYN